MSPGTIDKAVVRRHLAAIDRAVSQLRKHQGQSAAQLASNLDTIWAVERGLHLCAQNALDIATHLAAAAGQYAADYASAVDALGQLGVLPQSFVQRFRPIAGFRNVLVHAYLDVDPGRLHLLLNDRLEDFVVFARHVESYLASR